MKQAVNFRLDENSLTTIAVLANNLQTSKTDIIEKAVMQFAGTLVTEDADTILNAMQLDKSCKDSELTL